jgi:hypothetical protein
VNSTSVQLFWSSNTRFQTTKWRDRAIAAVRTPHTITPRPSVATRSEDFNDFSTDLEEILEIISDAANYGPAPKYVRDYERLRETVERKFCRIATDVAHFIMPKKLRRMWSNDSLNELLDRDNGRLIDDVIETRQVLTMYADHLRRLALVP